MIFKPPLARLIIAGKKTQTRRPVNNGTMRCRYKPGRDYAVQPGRGKPEIARIAIVDVIRQPLGDLTFKDARAEGFRTRDDFMAYWEELYGHVDIDLSVWAITFTLVRDEVRFLHRDSSHGYTPNEREAMPDEPEAIDERSQHRITENAHRNFAAIKAEELRVREARARQKRLREIETAARRNGIDLTDHFQAIDKQIEAMDRKLGHAA